MRSNLTRRSVLVGGLTAMGGLAASAIHAAEEKADKTEKPAQKTSGALTVDSLGEMLRALGLSPTKVESRFDFEFTAKHTEDWNLSMSAVLSTDEKSIWIIAWLDELPQSAADVPRTALLRLLADNDKLGKGQFFAYVPSVRRFVLQRTIDNQHMTSAIFKAALKDLGATVVDTFGHWKVEYWKQLGQPAAASKPEKEETGDDLKAGESGKSRAGGAPNARTAAKDAPSKPAKK
ncbi:MAG: type III secretion system chaperone [Planctomycetaceae bacterium]